MLCKIIVVCLFLGVVLADPVPEFSSSSPKESRTLSALLDESTNVARVTPTLIFDLLNAVIGYKSSALLIAVDIIDWLVSKSVIIAFGVIATIGFCKLTDKCNLDYEQYVPENSISQFRSLATPERLAQAEKFLVTAVEKYAQKKKHQLHLNDL